MEVNTNIKCHVVTFTREEFRQAYSSADKMQEFYVRMMVLCAENERRISANENDKTQL